MNTIPTAEEFLEFKNYFDSDEYEDLMIKFAKLHVKAALRAASNNATIFEDGKDIGPNYTWDAYNTCNKDIEYEINKQSILESYPLDQIK